MRSAANPRFDFEAHFQHPWSGAFAATGRERRRGRSWDPGLTEGPLADKPASQTGQTGAPTLTRGGVLPGEAFPVFGAGGVGGAEPDAPSVFAFQCSCKTLARSSRARFQTLARFRSLRLRVLILKAALGAQPCVPLRRAEDRAFKAAGASSLTAYARTRKPQPGATSQPHSSRRDARR